MVGVPGKYKGCETCRRRRVKCDNERPKCRKCNDTGRECLGYERERVFITRGIEDGGRVSSHPPRVTGSSSKKQQRQPSAEEDRLELMPLEPLTPAWDDLIPLSSRGSIHIVQIAALHTPLRKVMRGNAGDGSSKFEIALSKYLPPDMQPTEADEDFRVNTQCIAHLSPEQKEDEFNSYCIFLYEQSPSTIANDLVAPWRLTPDQMSAVRRLGPEHFRIFPGHHFFVRIYRPNAISTALLNRKDTFLSSPEWSVVPWQQHPKSHFDQLFDILVLLPSLLARADRVFPNAATVTRRLKAVDLLQNCLQIEQQLDEWLLIASQPDEDFPQVFWPEEPDSPDPAQIPFADNFAFKDSVTALMFLYYWMALILFHRCIERLHAVIFAPVVDAYPDMYPNLPAHLHIDPSKYQQVRDWASNICRSLDSALNITTQPDLLVAPLTVVHEFYREINTSSRDGELEMQWCERFRARLTAKGQDIADVIQSKLWSDLGRF